MNQPHQKPENADYAGDIDVSEAWKLLNSNPNSMLVDVRSAAEWQFVGMADLSALGKEPLLIEWQTYPGMTQNDRFIETLKKQLDSKNANRDTPLLFLCRSGARSRAAAIALSREGYTACYNVAGGFEGDVDVQRQRGKRNGWKAAGLPWAQS